MPELADRARVAVEVAPGARAPVAPAARLGHALAHGLGRFVLRQPLGAIGGLIVLVLSATAVFAPRLAPHGAKDAAFAQYLPPSAEFPMGTDQLGRDVLSRVIWGARLSLYVGLISVAFGVTLGALGGVITAYFGGLADSAGQRVVDVVMALPPIVLALALMAALGQSVNNVIIALVILLTPTAARTLRSVALSVKESPYVEAARAAGCSHWRIILLHVLPNSFATYIVLFTVNIAYAIVVEAALSFLGLGAPADEPSWGGMLTAGTQAIETAPWMIFFPGLAISLTVFGLNLLGDAIRDLTDPRLRGGLGCATQDRAMVTADPGDVFALIYVTGTGSNWGKWSDKKVDELVERGLRETNGGRRGQLYHELQHYLLTQDTTAVSVGWVEGWFFRDKRVRNYKISPTIYDHNTFMKVWLAQ